MPTVCATVVDGTHAIMNSMCKLRRQVLGIVSPEVEDQNCFIRIQTAKSKRLDTKFVHIATFDQLHSD